ncbi:MAG: metal ABC transporter permease [Gemmataceae bacterium]
MSFIPLIVKTLALLFADVLLAWVNTSDLYLMVWRAIVGITCTVPCALLGCYLVLRRMSMLGDAISHGVLPGIVLAVLIGGQITGWPIIVGAMIFGLLTAVLSQTVQTLTNVPEDASMGVVFTGFFALGVILISRLTFRVDLDTNCVLYGIFEAIPVYRIKLFGYEVPRPFPTMVVMFVLTIGFITLLWKELKLVTFDSGLATSMGFPVLLIHYLLMSMVAGVTVTAFEAVGSVLVLAMLVVPAACAYMLTDRLIRMFVLAALVATTSCLLGVIFAGPSMLNTNTAGLIAVMAGLHFALAVFLAPKHGVLAKVIRNARLGLRIVKEDILGVLFKIEEARAQQDFTTLPLFQADLEKFSKGLPGWVARHLLLYRGMVQRANGNELILTPKGREWAQLIVRSHRLWEKYLNENFSLPLDHLHDPATRMEHFIGPELQEQIASELQESDVDPHGKTIPPNFPTVDLDES